MSSPCIYEFIPFIPGDLVKIALALVLAPELVKRLHAAAVME